jgi:tRNA uridine 5-carbamoylmethylation protein Kti12
METAIASSPTILLDEVLAYQGEDIVDRFLHKYEVTLQEAEELFMETKKFLYLCITAPKGQKVVITDDLSIIDEMWHNFILFTREYHDFCQRFAGYYIHHVPTTKAERESFHRKKRESPEKAIEEVLQATEDMMGLTYDQLGEETVIKWFQEYPEKYSPEIISKMLK